MLTETESLELHNLLNDISCLKQKNSAKFDISVLLGDINFDDSRFTGHTQSINSFLEQESLLSVWGLFPIDFTFGLGDAFSTIDHFFISSLQPGVVHDAGVIHDPENLSGHAPIYMKLKLEKAMIETKERYKGPRINWGQSSDQQRGVYSNNLDFKLRSLKTPLPCQNPSCLKRLLHYALNQSTLEVLNAVIESAWETLEQTKGTTGDQKSRKCTIPGWNKNVKPFQEEARFWFCEWSSAGKPIESLIPGVNHDLYTIMRHTRNYLLQEIMLFEEYRKT